MRSISPTEKTTGDLGSGQIQTLRQKQLAVVLKEKYILIGAPDDVPVCLALMSQSVLEPPNTEGASQADLPLAVTVSRDDQRVEAFVRAVAHFRDARSQLHESTISTINKGAKSITTTYLAEDGLERRTRCPIGQIGALVALVAAQ
jgi:hypothetical protein